MEKKESKVFAKNVGWVTSASLINQILNVGFLFLSTRVLLPSQFGIMAIVLVITGFAEILINGGFLPALIQKRDANDEMYSSVFVLTFSSGSFFAISICLLAPYIANTYNEPQIKYLLYISSVIFLLLPIRLIPQVLFTKKLQYNLMSRIAVITNLTAIAASLALIYLGFGLWGLVAKLILQHFLSSLLYFTKSEWRPQLIFRKEEVTKLWRFGVNQTLSDSLGYWSRKVDDLLIGKFISSHALGVYSFAYNFLLFPTQLIKGQIVNISLPTIVQIRDDHGKVKKLYLQISSMLAFISFPVILGIYAVSGELVLSLMGEEWVAVIPVIKLFCIASLFDIFIIPGALFQAFNRADLNLKTTLITKSLNILAIIIGLNFGIITIAQLLIITSLIGFFVYSYYVQKSIGIEMWPVIKGTAIPMLFALLMLIPLLLLDNTLLAMIHSPLYLLILKISIGVFIWIISIIIIRPAPYKILINTIK